jgi:UDP-N-acetylmuramate dehydrogenase
MAEESTDAPLAPLTTLQLGGPADRLIRTDSREELIDLVKRSDAADEALLVLSGGSNVVIADQGFRGTVIQIATRGIESRVTEDGQIELTVQAGEPWDGFVARAVDDDLAGIECLSGIPGSCGATPIQNVGAYGQEVSSTISSVEVLERASGEVLDLSAAECRFSYRSSRFKGNDGFVVLSVTFTLDPSPESAPVAYQQLADALEIDLGMRAPLPVVRETVLELRRGKSMVIDPEDPDSVSAGSFFTNPILEPAEMQELERRATELLGPDSPPPSWPAGDGSFKTSAAWLIERAGFRPGYGDGTVGLSRSHTLALVNRGGASTAELVSFAREIANGVRVTFGVSLVPEPVFVGHRW